MGDSIYNIYQNLVGNPGISDYQSQLLDNRVGNWYTQKKYLEDMNMNSLDSRNLPSDYTNSLNIQNQLTKIPTINQVLNKDNLKVSSLTPLSLPPKK